jgi:hypothetical protein
LAFVDGTVLVGKGTIAVSHTVKPFSLVLNSLFDIDVFSNSMSETVLDLSFISGFVWPLVTAHSSNLVAVEFSLVHGAICPVEGSFTVQETVLQLTLVGVTVSELASSLAMIHLADL